MMPALFGRLLSYSTPSFVALSWMEVEDEEVDMEVGKEVNEEVDIEVPAPVYETMQAFSENNGNNNMSVRSREKRGIGTKIKCLFSKTS